MQVAKPNFFIIGARKSGTTSLYHYIKQHPEVYMSPVKETRYFAVQGEENMINKYGIENCPSYERLQTNSIKTESDYYDLFKGVKKETIVGEASPYYLYHPQVAQRIFGFNPHSKILAILRNPFDASYSTFLMTSRLYGLSGKLSFKDELMKERPNEDNYLSLPRYLRSRMYDNQLSKYYDVFPKNQIKVLLYEDLKNIENTMKSIFRFLNINEKFEPDTSLKYNMESKSTQLTNYQKLVNCIPIKTRATMLKNIPSFLLNPFKSTRLGASELNLRPTICPPEEKELMMPILKPHILRLQDLINRDLSHWL